jgi:hypothetical protein
MGSNAIGKGIGGQNNIVMGKNAGYNLGLPIQDISFGSGPYSNTNVNKEGYNVISVGSSSVKIGQYLVIIYNNNSVYEPQVIYVLSTTSTEATISSNLVTDINLITDKVYLLYGEKSTVVNSAFVGNNYIVVKTPKTIFDTLFNVYDKIMIQSILSTDSQTFSIVSTSVQSGTASTGTTRIIIDELLATSYTENDIMYLARTIDETIGVADTSIASSNIIMGNTTAAEITIGSKNIAIGDQALSNITTEKYNTSIGTGAGYHVQSDNNFLLGTKTGYYIDSAASGAGENVMIGFAAGQFAGITGTASNNVYIGNRVGQVNQGSNNVFIGNEAETASTGTGLTSTTYSNKLAIYKSDSGVPSNPLIGGDLGDNRVGVLTMEPKSSLDVKGSFGKSIGTFTQFSTNIDYTNRVGYTYDQYWDKTQTSVMVENTPSNVINYTAMNTQGVCLIDSEFVTFNEKGSTMTSLEGMIRGVYDSQEAHHLDGSRLFSIGAIKNIKKLSTDVPATGIISVNSTDYLSSAGLVVIDSEIIEYNGLNGGLGQATRGYGSSITGIHNAGTTCFNIAPSVQPLVISSLTKNITNNQTTLPMDPTGFPTSGNLIIGSEIMSYTDNTPFILNVTRGTNSTTADHHNSSELIYLVQNNTTSLYSAPLANNVTGGNTSIYLTTDIADFYNQGNVILDNEIIEYGSIAAIGLQRGTNGTTPSLHGVNSIVTLISDNLNDITYNYLDQTIDEIGVINVVGIDPNTIILNDASDFDPSGVILIEDEIISYTNKGIGNETNFLLGCTRGYAGTIATPHGYGTTVYKLDQLLLGQGTIKLLSSDASIMEFITGQGNFTKQGTIQVGSEIIKYSDKVLYDLTRGIGSTPIGNHIIPKTCHNFETLISTSTLNGTITDLTLDIPISGFNTLTAEGTILLESELITYSNGIGLYDVTRGVLDTPKTIHLMGDNIYSIPLLGASHSKLSYTIQSDESGIPVINNSLYSTSGIILVDSEIIAYQNKKTLDDVVRGTNNTLASSHQIDTNVSELTAISALSSLGSQLAQGEDAIVLDSITNFTAPGTALVQTLVSGEIQSEVINFSQIGKSLVGERGASGSTALSHTTGTNIYEINQIRSVPLGAKVEGTDVSLITASDNSSFTVPSTLQVGYEIIDYTSVNESLGVTRGYRDSTQSTHLNNQPVYDINVQSELTLSNNLTGNSRFKSTDTGIPIIDSVSSLASSGTIIVGSEIINYGSKNNSLVLNSLSQRGLYGSTIGSHNSGITVYNIQSTSTNTITDQTIHGSDFIVLDNTNTLTAPGYVRIDKEIIRYENVNNTVKIDGNIYFQTGGSFFINAGSTAYNMNIDGPTCQLTSDLLGNGYPSSDNIIINDSISFKEAGGYALLFQTGYQTEIVKYDGKNKTYADIGVTGRGFNNTTISDHYQNDIFSIVNSYVPNLELLENIDDTQTLIKIKAYGETGLQLIPSSGYLSLEDELIQYNNLIITSCSPGLVKTDLFIPIAIKNGMELHELYDKYGAINVEDSTISTECLLFNNSILFVL